MALLYLWLFLVTISRADADSTSWMCDDHHANFTTKEVVGTWHVVAIIPEKSFPDNKAKRITCYQVDFSEIDTAGLQWLLNSTPGYEYKTQRLTHYDGYIIRQRYYSDRPFDVWSKAIEDVNGCFQQVLSLDTDKTEFSNAITHDDIMQLHLLDTNSEAGPFLLQILWGKLISVVIYRRQEGVTQEELKPVYEFMTQFRGPQRMPRMCDRPLRNVLRKI